ncbi:MAG: segregation and condensation protein A [Candidatus Puniceispirillaceae bacterium]
MSDFTDTNPNGASQEADNRQLGLFVNLEGFEGPIDLLLSLAREQKVDLAKISILPLAEQYLQYISTARDLNLEVAADYLVMAAWLAYLKSRLLLPEIEAQDDEEVIDMTDALRYQLVRLEAMQSAAKRLSSLPRLGRARFSRGMPEYFSKTERPLWTATLYDLLAVYGDMRSVEEAQTLTIAATRLYSVQEASGRLRHLIKTSPGWTVLEQFLPPNLKQPLDRRSAIASHFVASLELAKEGVVNLRQQSHYGPLYLRMKELS